MEHLEEPVKKCRRCSGQKRPKSNEASGIPTKKPRLSPSKTLTQKNTPLRSVVLRKATLIAPPRHYEKEAVPEQKTSKHLCFMS